MVFIKVLYMDPWFLSFCYNTLDIIQHCEQSLMSTLFTVKLTSTPNISLGVTHHLWLAAFKIQKPKMTNNVLSFKQNKIECIVTGPRSCFLKLSWSYPRFQTMNLATISKPFCKLWISITDSVVETIVTVYLDCVFWNTHLICL